jgi:hypothetical protein
MVGCFRMALSWSVCSIPILMAERYIYCFLTSVSISTPSSFDYNTLRSSDCRQFDISEYRSSIGIFAARLQV